VELEKEPEVEVLTAEQFEERNKNVKVKSKFDGEVAEVGVKDLIKNFGLSKHLTKSQQEVAREREALLAEKAALYKPSQPQYESPSPSAAQEKPLRYWTDNEVREKYKELVYEDPWIADQFKDQVKQERLKTQAEIEKSRMDMAEKNFLVRHPELEPSDYEELKGSFSNPDFFRNKPAR